MGDWESYKTALTSYNKTVRKAKQSSWRDYSWWIKDVLDGAGLKRIMPRHSAMGVGSIKLCDGLQYTQS